MHMVAIRAMEDVRIYETLLIRPILKWGFIVVIIFPAIVLQADFENGCSSAIPSKCVFD